MAKTSSINRNEKRRKMSKTMGNKRAKLKAIVMKKDTPMEERFSAALKLAEMPRNSAKVRIPCAVLGIQRSMMFPFTADPTSAATAGPYPGMFRRVPSGITVPMLKVDPTCPEPACSSRHPVHCISEMSRATFGAGSTPRAWHCSRAAASSSPTSRPP